MTVSGEWLLNTVEGRMRMEIYAKNVVLKGKEKKNVLADECDKKKLLDIVCLLYTSPSPRD